MFPRYLPPGSENHGRRMRLSVGCATKRACTASSASRSRSARAGCRPAAWRWCCYRWLRKPRLDTQKGKGRKRWEKWWENMGNIWEKWWENMGNIWETYGTHMGKMMGKMMGNIWEKWWENMGNIWDTYGKNDGKKDGKWWENMGNIWETYGKHMGKMMGKMMGNDGKIWETYGKHMGNIWEFQLQKMVIDGDRRRKVIWAEKHGNFNCRLLLPWLSPVASVSRDMEYQAVDVGEVDYPQAANMRGATGDLLDLIIENFDLSSDKGDLSSETWQLWIPPWKQRFERVIYWDLTIKHWDFIMINRD